MQELWDAARGGGRLEATVQIGGCTASFVSPRGLLFTNHHRVTAVLQSHSSPERNSLRDGFLAATPEAELPASAIRAQLPHRFTDVSREIEAAVPAGAGDHQRFLAIDRKKKELVAACEKATAACAARWPPSTTACATCWSRCSNIPTSGWCGRRRARSPISAARSTISPGRAIPATPPCCAVWAKPDGSPGERADGNVPLAPRRFFGIAAAGVADGGFVMVTGYPSKTYRSTVHAEMAEWAELFFPQRAVLYRRFIDLLEAESGQC